MREASVEERALSGEQLTGHREIVTFDVEHQRFALSLAVVERVERAVAITPLTDAPPVIAGVIDVRGELMPVVALRELWGLSVRPLSLSDQLLIARGARRRYALLVDCVIDVAYCDVEKIASPESLAAHSDSLCGAVTIDNDIIFIHDLDSFLSLDAERELEKALGHV